MLFSGFVVVLVFAFILCYFSTEEDLSGRAIEQNTKKKIKKLKKAYWYMMFMSVFDLILICTKSLVSELYLKLPLESSLVLL